MDVPASDGVPDDLGRVVAAAAAEDGRPPLTGDLDRARLRAGVLCSGDPLTVVARRGVLRGVHVPASVASGGVLSPGDEDEAEADARLLDGVRRPIIADSLTSADWLPEMSCKDESIKTEHKAYNRCLI